MATETRAFGPRKHDRPGVLNRARLIDYGLDRLLDEINRISVQAIQAAVPDVRPDEQAP